MELKHTLRGILIASIALAAVAVPLHAVRATGTVLVQQPDGSKQTYTNVRIAIKDQAMAITSSDGEGTLVLGKAACSIVGALLECLPYDATLLQNGQRFHIPLQSGTVWINPTKTKQQLTFSSTQLPPHGVLLAVKSKRGTYVTLTGTVDEVQR